MMISGLFVIIGGWLPSFWMAILITGTGLIGMGLFYRIYTGLTIRKKRMLTKEVQV